MTEKRFSILSSYLGLYTVFDDKNGYPLSDYELLDLLNEQHETITDLTENLSVASNREISKDDLIERLQKENEQLKCGNKNLKAILNDFINICNRLQANLTDKQTLNVARDMLQNMGVDLE